MLAEIADKRRRTKPIERTAAPPLIAMPLGGSAAVHTTIEN